MIIIKSKDEIAQMKAAGAILAKTLEVIERSVKPGMSTKELDRIAEDFIRSCGGTPTFKGYGGFTGAICISLDDEVIHGIPGKKLIQNGSLLKVDVGVTYKGFCSDAARTYAIGHVSEEATKLMNVTQQSFFKGIEFARAGNHLSDISHAIQTYVESFGFSVVRDFVGHGIGKNLHEGPSIPNYGEKGRGPRLREGMALAIEPMVNAGTFQVKVLDDGWTVKTKDGRLSAHYENTVAITDGEPEILTMI